MYNEPPFNPKDSWILILSIIIVDAVNYPEPPFDYIG